MKKVNETKNNYYRTQKYNEKLMIITNEWN